MNVLLIYATYSGSTGEAAQVAASEFTKAGHTVTTKTPLEASPADCLAADFLLLASPSWDFDGKEGQPHEDFNAFFSHLESTQLPGKPYAVLGLGDSAYKEFCRAVDIIEEFMNAHGARRVGESLRIDKYFGNHENPQKVSDWSKNLLTLI